MPGKHKADKVNRLAAEVKALKLASRAVKVVKKAKRASKSGRKGGFFGSLGKSLGGAAGGFLGGLASKALMSITGMGDYKVHSNSLYVHALNSSPPPTFKTDTHSTRIVHREYLGDVLGNTNFTRRYRLPINAGAAQTFPWLSNVAVQYEEYRFHGLVFEFKSTSGVAVSSTNAALGTVLMATQYNTYAPDFTTKVAMDAYEYTVTTKPDCSALHPVECDPKLNGRAVYFVDTSSFAAGGDSRLSFMGNFYLYVVGQQSIDANLGELWVTYDVELLKPRLANNAASAAEANSAIYYNNSSLVGGVGPLNVNDYFAGVRLMDDAGGISAVGIRPSTSNFAVQFGTIANGYPNTLFFPPGFVGKILFIWTMYDSTGTSAGQAFTVSNASDAMATTTGTGIYTCTGNWIDPATCLVGIGHGAYECTRTTTAATPVQLAQMTMRYIWYCDGTASLDPITGRSQATVKFTGTPFGSAGTAVTWANRFEFFPVFV